LPESFGLPQHAFADSGWSSGAGASKTSAGQHQIREREQGMQLGSVLPQATLTRLAMLEQVLQHMKRVLDLGTHAGLGLLEP
jgi:hypothetical protein